MQILIMRACVGKTLACRYYDVDDVHLISPERLSWPKYDLELSKIVKNNTDIWTLALTDNLSACPKKQL